MHIIEADTYPEFLQAALSLLTRGKSNVAPRGLQTSEVLNTSFEIRNPLARHPNTEGRNANIFALIAETLWVLGGRNDVDFIQAYLPRMPEFSDDGVSIGGGYGPRIRNWKSIDQLIATIDTLKNDRFSRRAIISLFDPAIDHVQSRKDIPCNSVIQFAIRKDTLFVSVTSRSMDVFWGSAINVFEWTTLQEMMSYWLEAAVGTYTHHVGSLHIYEKFLDRGERLLGRSIPISRGVAPFDIPFSEFDAALHSYFELEQAFRLESPLHHSPKFASRWLNEVTELTRAFWLSKNTKFEQARQLLRDQELTENVAMALNQVDYMERQRE